MKISDEILVQQAQQGNERAFNQLVQRYQEQIINVCFRIVGNFQDAEEAAMDTFLACYRSLSIFEGRSSFATWLYRIATRTAYKRRGRCPPESIPIDELEIPENRLTTQPDRLLRNYSKEIPPIISGTGEFHKRCLGVVDVASDCWRRSVFSRSSPLENRRFPKGYSYWAERILLLDER
jgi:RNA polymerase sigma factor (sigma-70 family)